MCQCVVYERVVYADMRIPLHEAYEVGEIVLVKEGGRTIPVLLLFAEEKRARMRVQLNLLFKLNNTKRFKFNRLKANPTDLALGEWLCSL